MIFVLNFHDFWHTMYKCVLNLSVKTSLMFDQYFEYYATILRRAVFWGDTPYAADNEVQTVE